jgi:asparagine synthase (glutamine-hydrolysing)
MCGIAACWKKNGSSKDIVNNILKRIIHRGPDNCGILSYTDVTLGSCRLSILDL